MTVYIDGVPYPLNNKASTTANQIAHTILLPNAGPHSLELVLDSGKARFDAIEFRHIVPAAYGAYQHDSLHVAVNDSMTWVVTPSDQHSGGSYVWTAKKYASAFLLFNGTQATLYMHTGRDWGIASVYVDGRLHGEVDQYALDPGELFFAYNVGGLAPGDHVALEDRCQPVAALGGLVHQPARSAAAGDLAPRAGVGVGVGLARVRVHAAGEDYVAVFVVAGAEHGQAMTLDPVNRELLGADRAQLDHVPPQRVGDGADGEGYLVGRLAGAIGHGAPQHAVNVDEIGRASCRERV